MKVSDGKEKHFLVEVENDGAGKIEEHHLPGHQDYVKEAKITPVSYTHMTLPTIYSV